MPTSITALLIVLIAVFPGLIGNWVFQAMVGADWREKEFRTILRLVGFSVVGVVIYSLIADLLGLPPPTHLFPATYRRIAPTTESLNQIFIPYAGHLIGGLVAGILAAVGTKTFARFTPASAHPSAWDDFVRTYAPSHWVIVGLNSGEVYAGKLRNVDVAVAAADRDLVIEEPCQYNSETKQYRAVNYQYLFVPASSFFSIAAVHNPQIDKRTVPVGENLFSEGESNG